MQVSLKRFIARTTRRDVLRGVTLTALVVLAIELAVQFDLLTIPNPPALAVVPIIYASFSGGVVGGLLAGLVGMFYAAYYFSTPGTFLTYDGDYQMRMLAVLVMTPAIVLMISALRERMARSHEEGMARERDYRSKAETAAAAWQRSEQMLRLVMDTIPAMIAYIDADERYVVCNRLYREAFGMIEDRVAGQNSRETIGEELYGLAKPWIDKALAGEHVTYERRQRREDGSMADVSVSYVPHPDASGRALGFYAMIIDITEQKRATEALRESEEKLRLMADSLPALISYFDRDQVYRFANRTYIDWFGQQAQQVVGRTVRQVLGEDAYEGGARRDAEAALAGRTAKFERGIVLNGMNHQLDGTLVPHFDGSGQVAGVFVLVIDITERKALENKLAHMAQHDHLTRLPNRALFEDRLQQALERGKRSREPFTLMYLDIDHFKSVNDTLGHKSGDELLKSFATRLGACTRSTDTVARLGGDEFVMLLEGVSSQGLAMRVAEKIVDSVREPFDLGSHVVNVTTSIGVALVQGGEMSGAEATASADAALYQAKAGGRNRFHLAS
jgi:diguanylate cyclase (GGDEF)-like protein/PAS domain S-box-containing protein